MELILINEEKANTTTHTLKPKDESNFMIGIKHYINANSISEVSKKTYTKGFEYFNKYTITLSNGHTISLNEEEFASFCTKNNIKLADVKKETVLTELVFMSTTKPKKVNNFTGVNPKYDTIVKDSYYLNIDSITEIKKSVYAKTLESASGYTITLNNGHTYIKTEEEFEIFCKTNNIKLIEKTEEA